MKQINEGIEYKLVRCSDVEIAWLYGLNLSQNYDDFSALKNTILSNQLF